MARGFSDLLGRKESQNEREREAAKCDPAKKCEGGEREIGAQSLLCVQIAPSVDKHGNLIAAVEMKGKY